MTGTRTLFCVSCSVSMWGGSRALPQGEAKCRECRRKETTHKRVCPDCGGIKSTKSTRCWDCTNKAKTIRALGDHRLVRAHREQEAPGMRPCDRARLLSKWKRQNKHCAYCTDSADTIDHVVPLVRGGTNYEGNLVPACKSCNSSKGGRTVIEWRTGKPARRMTNPVKWKRKTEQLAIKGERVQSVRVCVCGVAYTGRRSDYCSTRCQARSAYRMKVGVPLDAAPYGVRASA